MYRPNMRTLFLILFMLIGLLAACRKKEEPTPTAAVATRAIVSTPVATSPATPEPEETPEVSYDWSPQLVYFSPAPGEEVKLDGAITLRFDQPMHAASVEEALSVVPLGEAASIDGEITWPRADTLVFTPRTRLARKQRYAVRLADTAEGQNGLPLRQAIDLQMESVGFLEVSQVIPAPGTDEVQSDAVITVLFNRPVVPLVATDQQAALPQPLSFDPALSGQGEWVSTSIFRFVPDGPLAGDTRYEVRVAAGLADVTGGELVEDFSWSFTTQRPGIVTIEPADRSDNIDPTKPITITFNMPMDQASTESSIGLDPALPTSFRWLEDGRVLSILPQERMELETTYQLTVVDTARSAAGQAGLDRAQTSRFSTVAFPAVVSTEPAAGALAERFQRGVSIRFASPMDLASLEDKVRIRPAPDSVDYFLDNFNFSLFLNFELERNTEYMVTVPGSVSDLWGNTLGSDYSWRFRTPGFAPLVSLNLPDQLSQLSRSHPSTVDVIHRNVSRVDAQLFDVGMPLEVLRSGYLFEFQPSGSPLRNWSFPTETERDVAGVLPLALAEGGVLPNGVYLLEITAPEIAEQQPFWQNQRNLIVVADTNLVVKEMFDGVYVWATDLASGQPVAGLNLTLYDVEGRAVGTATSDVDGFADFSFEQAKNLQGVLVVSGSPGAPGFGVASSNWNRGVMPWEFGVDTAFEDEAPRFAYLHTDRPIYRPGDTVHFRGIVRSSGYGRYALPQGQTVTVGLEFSTAFEVLSYEQTMALDENGEFHGDYQIPEDAELGDYRLILQDGFAQADRQFTVAQYRKPEFQVLATPGQEELLRGESTEVVVEASYFFGGPAADLPVNWTIYEDSYRLPWDGPFYSFGDDGDFFYEPGGPFDFGGGSVFGSYLVGGTGQTDSNGRLIIELPGDLLVDADEGSRNVTVEASVLDVSNFPVTARTSVVFHAAETYVGVVAGDYLGVAGTSTEVDLISVDWEGRPVANTEVEVTYFKREWEPIRDSEFNFYYTRWEAVDTEVDRVLVPTDAQGKGSASFVPPDGGIYLIVASVTDDGGRRQTSSMLLWVAAGDFVGWRADPRERRMDLVADQQEYRPGDTARILVQSPFAGPVNAWLTIERGSLIEQRLVTLRTNSDVLEIPITPDFAPNVHLTLAAVKGVDAANPYADIRFGITELPVSAERFALNLDLAPRQGVLEPGQTAVYDILVTDHSGNPVQAELSLALVDLAVLTLKADNAPHIVDSFYARQPYRSSFGSGLVISGEGIEIEIPLEQLGLGGGGGGGPEALRTFALESEEDEVRTDFRDTAFWQAQLATDASGQATVEIPLPDNLTTWRLSSKGVSDFAATGETLVGQASVDITVRLPLLVRPVTPRFFTVGDVLQLGAIVHNNTDQSLDTTVSLEASGLTLQGPAEQMVSIPAGGQALVRWPVSVDDVSMADLTFRAEAGELRDATKPPFGIPPDQKLPVYRFSGEDIVGTSGYLDAAGRRVEAILLPENIDDRRGAVEVQLSATLASALFEALGYVNGLEDRPACAHAVTDQLLPNVATLRALQILNLDDPELASQLDGLVNDGIDRLESLQKGDGGWGWCFSAESDEYLTAYSLFALSKAQESGFEIRSSVLDRGIDYLLERIEDAGRLNERWEANRQAFYLLVLAELGQADAGDLEALFSEKRALLDPYARALLATATDLAGGESVDLQALLADLNDSVIISATGAHWEDETPDWNNLSSNIRGTAMVIAALSQLDPDNPLIASAVRWLMVARTAGHWASGQENAWSIIALTGWLAASRQLEADYDYQLKVGEEQVAAGNFGRANITDSVPVSVPVDQLVPGEVSFLDFQRGEGPGVLFYSAHLDAFVSAEELKAVNRGVIVQRLYFDAACDIEESECQPIDRIQAGQQVRVELTIIAPNDLLFVQVEDPFPAGTEAIDPGLETSASGTGGSVSRTDQDYRFGYWGWWYFNRIEYRDNRVVFLSDFLPAGTYQYTYTLQSTIPGEYQVPPAVAREEFFPEVFGRSDGLLFTIDS